MSICRDLSLRECNFINEQKIAYLKKKSGFTLHFVLLLPNYKKKILKKSIIKFS